MTEIVQNKKGGSNLLKAESRLRKLLNSKHRLILKEKRESLRMQHQKPRGPTREQDLAPTEGSGVVCSGRLRLPVVSNCYVSPVRTHLFLKLGNIFWPISYMCITTLILSVLNR